MAEIVLDQVTKRYPDGTVAVDRVDIAIDDGEFFILVGPSGCGKSTLLNMLVGLESVTEGEIRLDGRVINGLDPKDRNMAMVFQSYALYPHMSVRENMAFPLKLAKLPRGDIDRRVTDTAAMLDLTELLDRRPRSLSGGQRQRVAMGRALVREPKAFLLDEPLSNLDAQLRHQTRSEIARLQRRLGITTVYVTHDQTEAMTLGDRIALLRQGWVQQVGTPQELYQRPANTFVAQFVGSPAMNLLPAKVHGGALRLPIGDIPVERLDHFTCPADGQELIIGLRPEHIVLVPSGAEPPAGQPRFAAKVQLIEWLGADLFIEVDASERKENGQPSWLAPGESVSSWDKSGQLVIRADPMLDLGRGDSVVFCVDPAAIHLFDAESGRRMEAPASASATSR